MIVHAAYSPPTVAATKHAFVSSYRKPIPSIFNTVLQELLVQQHFIRYAVNYRYNEVRCYPSKQLKQWATQVEARVPGRY